MGKREVKSFNTKTEKLLKPLSCKGLPSEKDEQQLLAPVPVKGGAAGYRSSAARLATSLRSQAVRVTWPKQV
jgi:hypothetical protein